MSLLLNSQLYAENSCVRWTSDGVSQAAISLDAENHMITVKTTKDNKKNIYHTNKLKVGLV